MEIWDLLDENGEVTGKTLIKGEKIPEGYYHPGADIWIINSKNEILIQKRAATKKLSPNVWAMTGGSVIKGETSLETIVRETKEELGIEVEASKLQHIKHYKTGTVYIDTYLLKEDIDLNDIIMQEDEVSQVKWATYEEIEELLEQGNFLEDRWEQVRDVIKGISN